MHKMMMKNHGLLKRSPSLGLFVMSTTSSLTLPKMVLSVVNALIFVVNSTRTMKNSRNSVALILIVSFGNPNLSIKLVQTALKVLVIAAAVVLPAKQTSFTTLLAIKKISSIFPLSKNLHFLLHFYLFLSIFLF